MGQRSSQLPPNVITDGCLSEVGTNSRLAFRSRKLHFSTGDEPADLCLPHVSVTMRSDEELHPNISHDTIANINGHCRSTEASTYMLFQQDQLAFQKSLFLQQKHLQSKGCQRSTTPTMASHNDQEHATAEGMSTPSQICCVSHMATSSTSSSANNSNPTFTSPQQYYQNQQQATNIYAYVTSGPHQKASTSTPQSQHLLTNSHNSYSHGSTTSCRSPFVKSNTIDIHLPAHIRLKEAEILRKYSDTSTANNRQAQLVAALLPEERSNIRSRRSTSPKLSPYNLSPRSLSPADRAMFLASSTVTSRSSTSTGQFSVSSSRERRPLVVTELNAALNQLNSRQRDTLPTTSNIIINHVPRITISGERSRHVSANSTEIINHHLKRLDGVRSEVNSPVNMFTDPSQSKSDTSLSILFTAGLEAPTNSASLVTSSTSNSNPCAVNTEQPKVGMSPTGEIAASEPTWSSDVRSLTSVQRTTQRGNLLRRAMTVDCEVPPDISTYPVSVHGRPTSILDNMRWPAHVPAQLQVMLQKTFQGHQLLTWLCNNINNVHYLSSRSELYLLVSQLCTCLIASEVLKPTETIKETPPFFKPEHLYTWSPWLRQSSNNQISDSAGVKVTVGSAGGTNVQQLHSEHEELINKMHREHIEELDRLRQENDLRIFQVKNESVMKVCQLRDHIEQLEQQVEKYRILAGIEGLLSRHEKVWSEHEPKSSSMLNFSHVATDTNELSSPKLRNYSGTTCDSSMQTLLLTVDQAIQCEERSQPPPRPKAPPSTVQIACEPPPAPPPPPPSLVKVSLTNCTPPPPPPPLSLVRSQTTTAQKQPQILTGAPMKTLFWKPIRLINLPQGHGKLWHDLSNSPINIKVSSGTDSFQQIFARPSVADSHQSNHIFDNNNKKSSHLRRTKSNTVGECKQPTKLLDAKRATNLGIFVTANQLTPEMVREALMLFDCGLLSLECMQMLRTVAPTDEDIEDIRNHMKSNPDAVLDHPEQFLLGLSEIAGFSDRLACLLMQYEHADAVASVECRLLAMVSCCQSLLTDAHVHSVLGLLLSMGNYMNAGSNRGNADGFGLDILNKLRDVKSTESNCTLLDYLVHQYINSIWRPDGDHNQMRCPLPEATDLQRATDVDLNLIVKEINEIGMQLEAFQRRVQRVLQRHSKSENSDGLEPFFSATSRFFVTAKADIDQLHATLADARSIFAELVVFYSECTSLTPTEFFKLWLPFCADFKDQMRKQLQLRLKKK